MKTAQFGYSFKQAVMVTKLSKTAKTGLAWPEVEQQWPQELQPLLLCLPHLLTANFMLHPNNCKAWPTSVRGMCSSIRDACYPQVQAILPANTVELVIPLTWVLY